MSFTIDT